MMLGFYPKRRASPLLQTNREKDALGTHPGLWQRDSSLGGVRDVQGKTELCGFRVRAGGTAAIITALSPLPVQPTGGCYLICVLFIAYTHF